MPRGSKRTDRSKRTLPEDKAGVNLSKEMLAIIIGFTVIVLVGAIFGGYQWGKAAGYKDGYQVGYSAGEKAGHDAGYKEGKDDGYKDVISLENHYKPFGGSPEDGVRESLKNLLELESKVK